MNKEILRNYWKNPQSVDLAHLKELNQLCEEYPYAVGLKQLYCKALIVHQDLNFEKVLKSTAIQTAQRGTLRSWLINDFQSNDKYLYPIFPTIEEEEEEEDFSSLTEVKEVVLENVKIEDEKIIEDIKEEVVLTVVETNDVIDVELPKNEELVSKFELLEDKNIKVESELKVPEISTSDERVSNEVFVEPSNTAKETKNTVNWDDIQPVQITLLPVPEQTKIPNLPVETEQIVEENEHIKPLQSDEISAIEEVKNYEVLLEQNSCINTENELVDKVGVFSAIEESDILDQQILNAAILGSSYQISESDNLPEKPNKKNKTSFVDWFDRIEKGDLNDEEFEFRKKAEKIIDQFLAKQPKIKIKKEFYSAENYVKKGSEENDDIISETLIKIYIQQGHIQKAIDGYSKLALKFPEKSNYFLSEIEKLKKV
ncbi:MAG: hypothetical protein RLZZ414_837 [Bacteroidota bacterium]|jgi:hypothetical protein